MKYRHKFIKKLKKEFPHCAKLKQLIEDNSVFLGGYLEDRSVLIFEPEEIISAFRKRQEYIIKEKAKKALRIKRLYNDWEKQYKRAVKNGKQHRLEVY